MISFKAVIRDRAHQQPAGEYRRGGDQPPQHGSNVNDKQEPDARASDAQNDTVRPRTTRP